MGVSLEKERIDILEYVSRKAKKPRHAPLFDSSLPTEKRRLEGRRMLTRRPEKDMTEWNIELRKVS
jgi:hypothetical protein